LYRDPTYLIQSTLVALLLLNLLTLAVFGFEGSDYAGKLGYIATLFLGLVAFIPSIRSGLPNLPALTLLEKQVFVTVGLLFLALFDSVVLKIGEVNGVDPDFYGSDANATLPLIVSSITFSLAILFTSGSFLYWLIRYIIFKRTIHIDPEHEVERKQDSGEFKPEDWYPSDDWSLITPAKQLHRRTDVRFQGYEYYKRYDDSDEKGDGYYRF